jgi:23S rRNA (pseudouridine1915-N3)-methyltransferase
MKIELWVVGKTSEPYLETGIAIFEKRLKNYLPFTLTIIPNVKKEVTHFQKVSLLEGEAVLAKLNSDDWLVLLDERGQEFTSVELSRWLERRLAASHRRIIFLIGGAFGFSPDVYARANEQLALSRMTFNHLMVRLFFLEQLYRAMTILKNEPYHNG